MTTSKAFELAGGPVRLRMSEGRLLFGRVDRPNVPQLVIRQAEGSDYIDLVIVVESGDLPALERPLAHLLPEALEDFFRPFAEALERSVAEDWSLASVEELQAKGMSIMFIQGEAQLAELGMSTGDHGIRMDMSRLVNGEVSSEMMAAMLHPPEVLLSPNARAAAPGSVMAFAPGERDGRERYSLVWIEDGESGFWIKRDVDRLGGRDLVELIDDLFVRRLPPRTRTVLESVVAELDLAEFVSVESLENLWKRLAGRDDTGGFDQVVDAAWTRVVDTEHHFSAGRFAAALARAHLSAGRPIRVKSDDDGEPAYRDPAFEARLHRLDGFEDELLRDAICKLVEGWEYSIGELWSLLRESAWASSRELYDRVSRASPDRPMECLAAFQQAGAPEALVREVRTDMKVASELRNLWTHRGTRADDRFFRLIGVQKQEEVELCGWKLRIRADGTIDLSESTLRAVAHRVGRSIAHLAQYLARFGATGKEPDI